MADKKVEDINPVRNCQKEGMRQQKRNKSKYDRISNGVKIITKGNSTITRRDLFEKKEEFHREQAKLPFEEKIKILVQLQKIANSIQKSRNKKSNS
ncbi:hypothetical protein ISS37_06870 [candidate division KSB1 bacterium]|nr:hypothetical protein [candidate division KSB1 bacterium]